MRSAFNLRTQKWSIRWPGRVARHDLVYASPPVDPMQGVPLGNGDVGTLLWCEPSRLCFAVNRSDLWEDADFDRFENWAPNQEERQTTLRHAARLVIDFKMPLFDPIYAIEHETRLSLADATLTLNHHCAFGRVKVKAWVDLKTGALHGEINNGLAERAPVEVTLERYGSRTFAHWYAQVRRDATIGLDGTQASADADGMYIHQQLKDKSFAVGVGIGAPRGCVAHYQRAHSRSVAAVVERKGACRFSLALVVTPPSSNDTPAQASQQLRAALEVTKPSRAHKQGWKAFWLRSLMEFGDDYLDNLWHLAMYYARSAQGGEYPGRFIDGLWGWNRDIRPWNHYFHWNQQQLYWPLNAAGHHDLVRRYIEYRFSGLPHARQDAREYFGVAGAFVSDVCDRSGRNSLGEKHNHTPVAQIALTFWRQYRFTGDRAFLVERAIPYLEAAAMFFELLLEFGEDGRYHARGGTAYEGDILLRDGLTELACAEALFDAVVAACEDAGLSHERLDAWRHIRDHLAPLPTTGPKGRGLHAAGYTTDTGEPVSSFYPAQSPACEQLNDLHETIALRESGRPGVVLNKQKWENTPGIFPGAEYACVFPSGRIGLGSRRSRDYRAAVRTARTYGEDATGWDPLPIVFARLGLGPDLANLLEGYPDRWQIYPNGFTHWGVRSNIRAEAGLRFGCNSVQMIDKQSKQAGGRKTPCPSWPFRHASLEALYVLACALQEALLQSHDGVIRVAPAVGRAQQARFTLHAEGGFVVSAEILDGQPRWVFIRNLRGQKCMVELPWKEVWCTRSGRCRRLASGGSATLHTPRGACFMLTPGRIRAESWRVVGEHPVSNRACKTTRRGLAKLGLPRDY